MEIIRKIGSRDRNLRFELSLWNPLFIHSKPVIKVIEDYLTKLPKDQELTILDFGCGQKPYQIFASNHRYIGIDIDKKNDKADIYADITKVPIEDGIADIVVSFFALEHVYEPRPAIKEMSRVLKKQGSLFMIAPLYWEEHEQPYDYFRYTRFSLKRMLEEAGFCDIYIQDIGSSFSIVGLNIARILDSIFLFRFLVPIVNIIFYNLDRLLTKRIRQRDKINSNALCYAIYAKKYM